MVRGFAASAWSAITACSIGARRRNTTPTSRAFTRIIRDKRHCSQEASARRTKFWVLLSEVRCDPEDTLWYRWLPIWQRSPISSPDDSTRLYSDSVWIVGGLNGAATVAP